MNYKEFKKEIEKVNYLYVEKGLARDVYVKSKLDMNSVIACIEVDGKVDFTWHGVIKAAHMQKAIKLIEDFAETPYEERMDMKFYIVVGGNRVKEFICNIERDCVEADPEYKLEITFSNKGALKVANFEKPHVESIFKRAGVKFDWEEA